MHHLGRTIAPASGTRRRFVIFRTLAEES